MSVAALAFVLVAGWADLLESVKRNSRCDIVKIVERLYQGHMHFIAYTWVGGCVGG